MAKSQEDIAADLIHAVLDFIHQTEFEDVMPAIYRLIRAVWPDSTEIDFESKDSIYVEQRNCTLAKKGKRVIFLVNGYVEKR